VLAYEKGGFLVDYLRHPDYIFDNPELARERRGDAWVLLLRHVPGLKQEQVHVAPLDDFD
jgi:hypothetical protein